MKGMANVGLTLIAAGLIKLYGEYKYYSGKVDANEFNEVIIKCQSSLIDSLLDQLKKKDEEES